MSSLPCQAGPTVADLCLRGYLDASSQEDADRELASLLEQAAPLITGCLGRRVRDARHADVEDAVSEARTQLVLRLQRLRGGERRQGDLSTKPRAPISDFGAYVVTVAYTAWAGTVRRRHPARAMLLNRLRYLLEGRTNQRGFALWNGPGGELWAGFEAWRERSPEAGAQARQGRLAADPLAVAAEVFGVRGWESLPLPELVSRLFAWLGGPLRLRDLTDVVAECHGIAGNRAEPLLIDAPEEACVLGVQAAEPSPHDALRWKEYLGWLIQEAARLTLRQRSAFLLHSSCLLDMELLGMMGIRQAARLLELPPEQMAEHWTALPLEDRVIGAILQAETQQVINLRKVARGILGRAWQRFLDDE